jgi:hypothetical protein
VVREGLGSPTRTPSTTQGDRLAVNITRTLFLVARELTESEWRKLFEQFHTTGTIDANGILFRLSPATQLLIEMPSVDGNPHVNRGSFEGAIFDTLAWANFDKVTFTGVASFRGTTFHAGATFIDAAFQSTARFADATFHGQACFSGTTFGRYAANFHRARFLGPTPGEGAIFNEATFDGLAYFHEASLGDMANFAAARFDDGTDFSGATFGVGADFSGAKFGNEVRFFKSTFADRASFAGTQFGEDVNFGLATFGNFVNFDGASFGQGIDFRSATFFGQASFERATFCDGARFGPLLVAGIISLDGATFSRPERIEISAALVYAHRIVVPFGATLLLRWAELELEATQFAQPTIVALSAESLDSWMEAIAVVRDPETGLPDLRLLHPDTGKPDPRPRITSLRETNVERLVLSDVNLAACRPDDAHQVDRLRWEGSTEFARAPTVWRWRPIWPFRRGRGRQALAVEHAWRRGRQRRRRRGWCPPACGTLKEEVTTPPNDLAKVASIYRALRKAREDVKDEPGAADFYYGEMEMRRHAAPRSSVERTVLLMYWLLSGYGLRASRALGAFAALLLLSALGLWKWGLERHPVMPAGQRPSLTPDVSYWAGLLESAESATSLFRQSGTPQPALTVGGIVLQIVLRVLGPALLGLAVLALRGRVKR